MELTNTLIYLFGFSGIGKLTIAREIQKLMPAILVDNHLINNVVFSLIDADGVSPLSKLVWENTNRVREVVLDTIRTLSHSERNFIFTNELIEGSLADQDIFAKISTLATQRRSFFFPVRLLISVDELCRRTVFPERRAQFKSIDADAARAKAMRKKVFQPSCPYFELEVSTLSAEESAQAIMAELQSRYCP